MTVATFHSADHIGKCYLVATFRAPPIDYCAGKRSSQHRHMFHLLRTTMIFESYRERIGEMSDRRSKHRIGRQDRASAHSRPEGSRTRPVLLIQETIYPLSSARMRAQRCFVPIDMPLLIVLGFPSCNYSTYQMILSCAKKVVFDTDAARGSMKVMSA